MAGSYHSADATVSARRAAAVTASDATILPATRGLYVGGAGNLSVVMAEDGLTVPFVNIPEGTLMPLQVIQVLAATTATSIVALW